MWTTLLSSCKQDSYNNTVKTIKKDIVNNLQSITTEKEETYSIDMERVKNWPLGKMKGLNHNLAILLWGKYTDSIIMKYNEELMDTLIAEYPQLLGKSLEWVGYNNVKLNEIKVPLVYPSLEDFFDESLEDFLGNNPHLKEQVGHDSEVIIVTRNYETRERKDHSIDTVKKHVIWYYVNGKLNLAQYMSAGRGKDILDFDHIKHERRKIHAFTKEGVFYTNYNAEIPWRGNKRDSTYASGTFGKGKENKPFVGAAMPYAIPINNEKQENAWVFLHTGYADGTPRSHECNRLPWWAAMYMYDHIGDRKVKTVVDDMYDNEDKKPITKKKESKPVKKSEKTKA